MLLNLFLCGLRFQAPCHGLCPWTPLDDSRPQTSSTWLHQLYNTSRAPGGGYPVRWLTAITPKYGPGLDHAASKMDDVLVRSANSRRSLNVDEINHTAGKYANEITALRASVDGPVCRPIILTTDGDRDVHHTRRCEVEDVCDRGANIGEKSPRVESSDVAITYCVKYLDLSQRVSDKSNCQCSVSFTAGWRVLKYRARRRSRTM